MTQEGQSARKKEKHVKVSLDEMEGLLEITKGRKDKDLKYAFYLGFILGSEKGQGKHKRLRSILRQKRLWG